MQWIALGIILHSQRILRIWRGNADAFLEFFLLGQDGCNQTNWPYLSITDWLVRSLQSYILLNNVTNADPIVKQQNTFVLEANNIARKPVQMEGNKTEKRGPIAATSFYYSLMIRRC